MNMTANNVICICHHPTPAGNMIIGSYGDQLCLCDWENGRGRDRVDNRIKKGLNTEMAEGSSPITEKAITELEEYFSGNRFQFDIPLLFIGTEFQKIVWNKLLTLRYGYTLSYGEMARQLGCYKSARAVANAIGANAISIFTPCHRVIGSTPNAGGYRGGMEAKKLLLDMEDKNYHRIQSAIKARNSLH